MPASACSPGMSARAGSATYELDGFNLIALGAFEGNLWAGEAKARMGMYIDERADPRQREALQTIFGGHAGGWPAGFAANIGEMRGIEFVPDPEFEVAGDLATWRAEIPGRVVGRAEALTGPTTPPGKQVQTINPPGSEVGPGQVATWGRSTEIRTSGFGLDSHRAEPVEQAHPLRLDEGRRRRIPPQAEAPLPDPTTPATGGLLPGRGRGARWASVPAGPPGGARRPDRGPRGALTIWQAVEHGACRWASRCAGAWPGWRGHGGGMAMAGMAADRSGRSRGEPLVCPRRLDSDDGGDDAAGGCSDDRPSSRRPRAGAHRDVAVPTRIFVAGYLLIWAAAGALVYVVVQLGSDLATSLAPARAHQWAPLALGPPWRRPGFTSSPPSSSLPQPLPLAFGLCGAALARRADGALRWDWSMAHIVSAAAGRCSP